MEAMASRSSKSSPHAAPRLAHLWQVPLLLLSVGLFGTAAYLFVNPGGGMTIDQKIDIARVYLKYNRPEAALDQLNKLIVTEKLALQTEGRIHLLLAETLEAGQKVNHISLVSNHERIIEQTRLGLAQGAKADPDVYRRLGESYEALGRPADALESYRRAMAMDPEHLPHLQRKVIELQLQQPDLAPAEASIEEYLRDDKLADAERAWALQRKAQVLVGRGAFIDAKAVLNEALRLNPDPISQGEAHYRLGYCVWKMGDPAEAERLMRVARDQLKVANPLDAEAAYYLGKIRQEQNDPKEAIAFYQAVLSSHPESEMAGLARLGRGECRIILGQSAGGVTDLQALANQIAGSSSHQKYKADVIAGVRQSSAILAAQEKYQEALDLLASEQQLDANPSGDFFNRLAQVYDKRAQQVDQTVADAPTAVEKIRRQQQVRDLRTRAGDAYIACSRSLTLSDDKAHAEAMWKGVDLFDRAGNLPMVMSALELFAAERPDDGQTPDALLRLGRAYQAAGLLDKAIGAFQRNQMRYPQSLAATKSGVPLAQAYISKGPEFYSAAEKVLLGVTENPSISPEAEEFGQALFELSQLYYRTARYEEAVIRLGEMTQRYPHDARMPQLLFLMADSYRQTAGKLDAKLKLQPNQPDVIAARKDRLTNARKFYDRVVDLFPDGAPTAELDKLYLKLSYFYRADCLYDLEQYDEAIKLYDKATTRYPDDPASLAGLVQIVNANVEMGKINEAKLANERAKTLLTHMPPQSFNDGTFSMPKDYWVHWLNWTSQAGLWNGMEDARQAAQKFANGDSGQ